MAVGSRACSSKATGAGTHGSGSGHVHVPLDKDATFINRVAALGADALLGPFLTSTTKFDRTLVGLTVDSISQGGVVCSMDVNPGIQNTYGTLHGGAVCTLVDVVGTMALLTTDPTRAGVSVDLNVNFLSAAPGGARIVVEGRVLKTGKRLGFTQVDIFVIKLDGTRVLAATGRHTKAL